MATISISNPVRIYDNSTMSRKKRTLGLENYYTTSNELVLLRKEKLISVNKKMFNDGREDSQQYKDEYKKLMSLEECLPKVTDVGNLLSP